MLNIFLVVIHQAKQILTIFHVLLKKNDENNTAIALVVQQPGRHPQTIIINLLNCAQKLFAFLIILN